VRRLARAFLVLVAASTAAAEPACRLPERIETPAVTCRDEGDRRGIKGDFDHYVLMFSWSPEFCASPAGRGPDGGFQCRGADRFGWVVHGLWPQNREGRTPPWPQFCAGPSTPAPADIRQSLCSLPGARLATCQWRKHGTCSDFERPADYLAAIRDLDARVRRPDLPTDRPLSRAGVLDAWVRVNRHLGLDRDAVALRCEGDRVEEVAICLARGLDRDHPCGRSLRRCPDQVILRPIAPR
jgi:ribonuclease T2